MHKDQTISGSIVAVYGTPPPTLVCVPAFADSGQSWSPLVEVLARECQVAVIRLPGLGSPGPAPVDASVRGLSTLLAGLVRDHWSTPVTLVGHSLGAPIAIRAAHLLGRQCQALVSIEGNLTVDDGYFTGQAGKHTDPSAFKASLLSQLQQLVDKGQVPASFVDGCRRGDAASMWRLGLDAQRLAAVNRDTRPLHGGVMSTPVNATDLTAKVKKMYQLVAERPHATYHFELGRPLALRLGYAPELLDRIPAGAVDSFAGVGYFFDLANLGEDETVLDLGSGSGMDAFYARRLIGPAGRVIGVDFTPEQLSKARRLSDENGMEVEFHEGRIESLPLDDESVTCVISNGVINLSPDKARVFAEAARVLRPGGRLAIADIVSEKQLTHDIVCNADLWASCIGGAAQQDDYRDAIEQAGLTVLETRANLYEFISDQARNASGTYGVKSISLLATKPAHPDSHG